MTEIENQSELISNNKIISYDFEVFRYDTLFGADIIDADTGSVVRFQTWDKEEMKAFYELLKDCLWVGWNIGGYDNIILETVLKNKNTYEKSKEIISGKRGYSKVPRIYFDLMIDYISLKVTECFFGKNIHESGLDFDMDRHLTLEEKIETEGYNGSDLDQTRENLYKLIDKLMLQKELIREFDLPEEMMSATEAQITSRILGCKKVWGIDNMPVKPKMYESLRVKNKAVIDFYLSEKFRTTEKLKITVCGVDHVIGSGGIHAARKRYHAQKALYMDVSGYYNLIMLRYNLLSRAVPQSGFEKYEFCYEHQLELKKTNPYKRVVYKTVLLAAGGAMLNEYSDFYDPWHGYLLTITGQLFLIDLLEKLEGKVELVQSNTDGIMVVPLVERKIIDEIVKEWQDRTQFNLHFEEIFDVWQRDVNNYMFRDKDGKFTCRGEWVHNYDNKNVFDRNTINHKQPLIIDKGIVDYFIFNRLPEETVNNYLFDLNLFQFIGKKGTFEYVENQENLPDGTVRLTRVQNVNRVFANNDTQTSCQLYKCAPHKITRGAKRSRLTGLPENCFVYNNEINSEDAKSIVSQRIDYQWYIDRIYMRINEFYKGEDEDENVSDD